VTLVFAVIRGAQASSYIGIMPLLECPVCHQKPAYAGNTAYCPHCGWNRDSAISGMKMSINAIPIGLFMFGAMAAFLYWGMKFSRAPQLLLFMLFPISFIPLNYFLLKRKIAKLKSMPTMATQPVPSNFGNGDPLNRAGSLSSAVPFAPSPQSTALLGIPPPRRVRISKQGRITLWVAAIGLSMFVVPAVGGIYRQWVTHHSFSNVRGLGWLVALECIVALAIFGIWRGQVRESDLLENGEIVMGRVVRQWTDDKRNSQVEYEFTDFLGSLHKGAANDRTNQLFSGMPLVVFYDRDNPKRQIAYCSTLHEVILPSTTSAIPDEVLTKR
jgi:hypothetical protein